MNKEKLCGETYEINCKHGCYSIVNNGGSESTPQYCPYCGNMISYEEIKEIELVLSEDRYE